MRVNEFCASLHRLSKPVLMLFGSSSKMAVGDGLAGGDSDDEELGPTVVLDTGMFSVKVNLW